jgi:hypothetical protein
MQGQNPIETVKTLLSPDPPISDGHGAVRGRKEERMILALLEHSSVEKAAASLRISEATLWRRLKDPMFQDALRRARREAFSRAVARLQQASSAAVTTLLRIMCDGKTPASSRVRAALSVLELAFRSTEVEDMQTRIERLEQLAQTGRVGGFPAIKPLDFS